MSRTIIIGYGNVDRADDGVAHKVINALRQLLGQKPLNEDDTGLEELGGQIDSIFVSQLMPEIMEVITGYELVVFVDAHVGDNLDDLSCTALVPEYVSSTFTHHMVPSSLLAFLKVLYNHEPAGYLVSIRGHNFDFNRNYSPQTTALIQPAAGKILQLLENQK